MEFVHTAHVVQNIFLVAQPFFYDDPDHSCEEQVRTCFETGRG
jgi:hypothetical protein